MRFTGQREIAYVTSSSTQKNPRKPDIGVTLVPAPPSRILLCGPLVVARDGEWLDSLLRTAGTELAAAVRAERQLVRLVPLPESGYQILMRALALEGNVAEALTVYGDLRRVLRAELGVSPSTPSQAVYESVLRPEQAWVLVLPYSGVRVRHAGPLAQLAEQRTFNPRVLGSIPRRPTPSHRQFLLQRLDQSDGK